MAVKIHFIKLFLLLFICGVICKQSAAQSAEQKKCNKVKSIIANINAIQGIADSLVKVVIEIDAVTLLDSINSPKYRRSNFLNKRDTPIYLSVCPVDLTLPDINKLVDSQCKALDGKSILIHSRAKLFNYILGIYLPYFTNKIKNDYDSVKELQMACDRNNYLYLLEYTRILFSDTTRDGGKYLYREPLNAYNSARAIVKECFNNYILHCDCNCNKELIDSMYAVQDSLAKKINLLSIYIFELHKIDSLRFNTLGDSETKSFTDLNTSVSTWVGELKANQKDLANSEMTNTIASRFSSAKWKKLCLSYYKNHPDAVSNDYTNYPKKKDLKNKFNKKSEQE